MFTKAFWTAALERSVKTAAQAAIAIVSVGAVSVLDVDWQAVAGVSGTAALVSVLTSLGSIPLSNGNSPSLVPEAEIEAAVN
jgi:hypothetical protein